MSAGLSSRPNTESLAASSSSSEYRVSGPVPEVSREAAKSVDSSSGFQLRGGAVVVRVQFEGDTGSERQPSGAARRDAAADGVEVIAETGEGR